MSDDQEKTVRQLFWPKLKQNLARIPFAEDSVAAFLCASDRATPVKVKGALIAALAYFILPVDVIPDFIIGLGYTDDLAVLMTAITMVKNHITQTHRLEAARIIAQLRGQAVPGQSI
jgi:uncharacterized membrane protein YkvA (DUF1232 family)